MFKKLILLGLLVFTILSCEYVIKNKNEVLALQKKNITYDDFTNEFNSFNQTVYFDKNRDRMNGHFTVMYKDKVSEEFEVKNGLLNGFLKNYYPEGVISKVFNYKNGKLHGESVFYLKDGNIHNKATYKNGKLFGDNIGYDKFGNVTSVRKIVEDIEYHHLYQDGKMILSQFKKNIDGTVYELMVKYDAFENISFVVGFRDYELNSKTFYVFDKNFKLIEAVDAEQEPSKAAYYFGFLNTLKK